MKKCAYCGKENEDTAIQCHECATEFSTSLDPPAPPFEPAALKLEFLTPTPQDMEGDLVTLLRFRTLMEADMVVSQLESAGIPSFIPDQYLMQNIAFNPQCLWLCSASGLTERF